MQTCPGDSGPRGGFPLLVTRRAKSLNGRGIRLHPRGVGGILTHQQEVHTGAGQAGVDQLTAKTPGFGGHTPTDIDGSGAFPSRFFRTGTSLCRCGPWNVLVMGYGDGLRWLTSRLACDMFAGFRSAGGVHLTLGIRWGLPDRSPDARQRPPRTPKQQAHTGMFQSELGIPRPTGRGTR